MMTNPLMQFNTIFIKNYLIYPKILQIILICLKILKDSYWISNLLYLVNKKPLSISLKLKDVNLQIYFSTIIH